jgi:RecB family exonuclease
MLQIVYFTGKDEFIEFVESKQTENLFVTASPAKADTIRTSLKDPLRSDVITISKFTGDFASMLWPSLEDRPKIKKKAELLLNFGILKNKYLPWLTFEDFKDAYGVFSDLRSFSLQYEVISQVLAEESENVRLAVELFWKLLDLTGDIDEHGAYAQLAEQLRSADEIDVFKKKNIIFWGFQHLNGQQIDLIKALAIRYRVIIPFPARLENSLRPTDWISWLLDGATEIVHPAQINSKPILQANLIPINSREIASTLKYKLEKHDQVILGVSKLNPAHSSLIPYNSVNFKIPLSLIDNEIRQLHDEIEQLSKELSLRELQDWLKEKKVNSSLKMLKAIQLFEDACEYFLNVTDQLIIIDRFLLKLIQEVSLLNQPRNYLIPILSKEADIELLDLSSIDQIHGKGRVFICIDEKFQDILSLTSKYSEDIQKYLSPIGPLKRSELDLQFKKWELESLIEKYNVIFLMPQDVLKHNLIWKKILEEVNFTNNIVSLRDELKKENINWYLGKKFNGDFSASRLQTYLDCPKKFYFSHVEKLFPNIKLKKDIDPKISGTIVHKIIEEFIKLKTTQEFDLPFTRTIFDVFIQQEQLSLPFEVYEQRLIQLHHRAHNGIEFLKSIEKNLNISIPWEIEKKFEILDRKLKGQIDCIGETETHLFLLDFKSTKSAASSFKEIEEYESIQLWIYAQAARKMKMENSNRPIVFGYIVLDDPEDSLLISDDEEMVNNLKALKISRTKKIDDFEDALEKSQQVTDSLMQKIFEESSFVIKPRKSEVCFFCELNPVCPRKETGL